jgi:hypothetical protein
MRVPACVLAAACSAVVLSAQPARAEAPWPEAKIGKHWCFADHVHYGSSKGQPSKKAALAAAAASYSEGIVFEYGNGYESWSIAAKKNVACYQEGGGWACVVYALPCRKGK